MLVTEGRRKKEEGRGKREEGRGKKAILAIGNDLNGGHGSAVSLPRLIIVGTRHCRVLIVGNINSDATGFDITASACHFPANFWAN